MKKKLVVSMLTMTTLLLVGCSAGKTSTAIYNFPIIHANGSNIGEISIKNLGKGGEGVDLNVSVKNLTPGTHAMHFHEFGRCDGPDYKSAGGHFNPEDVAHGKVEDGPHAGDMMNIEIAEDGTGRFQVTNTKVNFIGTGANDMIDADGTALIIHAGADDYKSQPSGAAGPRVACAVISAG